MDKKKSRVNKPLRVKSSIRAGMTKAELINAVMGQSSDPKK